MSRAAELRSFQRPVLREMRNSVNSPADLELFERSMLPHLDAAYNLARWLTRNAPDAEDLVQEAFLRALRFFHSFNGGHGRAWLLAVVRNTHLTRVRRGRDAREVPFDETLHSEDRLQDAEIELVHDAEKADLRTCLESLPLDFRTVLVMRELEEMSYKDIAYASGMPVGTVMSRLSRARRLLQACMARCTKGVAS